MTKSWFCVDTVWFNKLNFSSSASGCPKLKICIDNSQLPEQNHSALHSDQPVGTRVVHVCAAKYVFSKSLQPINVYVCEEDGFWSGIKKNEHCTSKLMKCEIFFQIF